MIAQIIGLGFWLVFAILMIKAVNARTKFANDMLTKPFEIYPRRGTAAEWTAANPVLRNEEVALEQDTRKIKIGDGKTAWNQLAYESELMPAKLVPCLKVYRGA